MSLTPLRHAIYSPIYKTSTQCHLVIVCWSAPAVTDAGDVARGWKLPRSVGILKNRSSREDFWAIPIILTFLELLTLKLGPGYVYDGPAPSRKKTFCLTLHENFCTIPFGERTTGIVLAHFSLSGCGRHASSLSTLYFILDPGKSEWEEKNGKMINLIFSRINSSNIFYVGDEWTNG